MRIPAIRWLWLLLLLAPACAPKAPQAIPVEHAAQEHLTPDQLEAPALERKHAQEELKSSEERYRSLVELSPDALFVQQEDKVVFINSAGVKLFGACQAEELIGKPVRNLIHPSSWRSFKQRIQRVRESGKPAPFLEQKMVRQDGMAVDAEVAAAPRAPPSAALPPTRFLFQRG